MERKTELEAIEAMVKDKFNGNYSSIVKGLENVVYLLHFIEDSEFNEMEVKNTVYLLKSLSRAFDGKPYP